MASHVMVVVTPKGKRLEAWVGQKEKLSKGGRAIKKKFPGSKYRVCELEDLGAIRRAAKGLGFERAPNGLYVKRT